MSWLRSLLFTALMFLSVPPWALVVIAARLWGTEASYRMVVLWCRAVMGLLHRLCGLRFVVQGLEHLPAEPSVVLLKHSSAMETIAQIVFLPRQCWVLKRELMWAPFLGWALATLRPIAIDRSAGRAAVEQVVTEGTRRLAEGIWVTVFPEGTRMPPGETRRYGVSGTLLAQRAGRPLVPVAHNAGDYWPRRGLRKKPGVVIFRIGPPVLTAGRDPREINNEVQAWIEAQVAELRRDPVA
jgi:1-acyl-sn-glycerol-3-phosphate acyltransferase